ncbi:MAG: 30S ribosomal protein S7 [Berkelbacteria bacterium GW2011_GWB1_38_5]|uniref:Small ribosomal subunit protein uS7 n=1 Tax=Berkelbacteria bacterium GW2011_GWB1_38_5 TaxID=1618336 RepID=A0A0G0K5E0_9BACT|nr:MAG: 30S ribosomal protein S7 [Berkelbacteria bacterium GW2011_GWB1_38_5]
MRGKRAVKRKLKGDPKYQSVTVEKFINKIMLRGQKETARNLVYHAFDILKDKTKKEPLEVFEASLKNTAPLLEVRPKRIGGATYQVPMEVAPFRRETLAMRWIINAARKGKGASFEKLIASELLSAYENTGVAIKQKENMHRMAEANKAFAHYARF